MPVSKKITASMSGASLVRKMFEEGLRLKAKYGADNVFDFSIGNPDVPPPQLFKETLLKIINEDRPGIHGYMPNAGWPAVREKVAKFLTEEQGAGLSQAFNPNHIVMTAGAAGALNVVLKAVLDQGDEVLTPKPCFMEYHSYADNHGGTLVMSPSLADFSLDLASLEKMINEKTRVVLINSPHNPTGTIYSADELKNLGVILKNASQKFGRPIILVADEPYRKLAYDGHQVPSIFPAYPYSVVVTSHSKDMSLPGERIGYLAINPDMPEGQKLFEAASLANRILGFVSAPSLQQLAVGEMTGTAVDLNLYQERRDVFVKGLQEIGYQLTPPKGAFYLFPKSPISDDLKFVDALKKENVLTVPGTGFAQPGYFRICYCVPMKSIKNSLPGFAKVFKLFS